MVSDMVFLGFIGGAITFGLLLPWIGSKLKK